MNWILASASPRRKDILTHLGLSLTIITSSADENIAPCAPEQMVQELAKRKTLAVYDSLVKPLPPHTVIIGADTLVQAPDGEILGKPKHRDDAKRMLRSLSGREHRVLSGICICNENGTYATACETTRVVFSTLSDSVIDAYVAGGECDDKAGAYGVQDTAALWISAIHGDYFNVVGLPVHRLETLLGETFGVSLKDH